MCDVSVTNNFTSVGTESSGSPVGDASEKDIVRLT
jgi:hypothetical protein